MDEENSMKEKEEEKKKSKRERGREERRKARERERERVKEHTFYSCNFLLISLFPRSLTLQLFSSPILFLISYLSLLLLSRDTLTMNET